jgi:phosphoribosyl-AMP cyclohydrolase
MLLDCVDILRSITKSCGDNVGGVNKRVWITQLQQIESYTYDSLGYVNSITTKEVGTTNYGYELKKVISKKGSHSGNVEAIENVNVDVFKHTAILKAYATTPEQRDSLVSLYGASKVVVFFETDNGEIEIYGLENGLYATALTGNTGEQMQDDTAFTFTLSGLQTSLPKYFLYGGSLATSIAYLDEIGLNPIYVIQEYSAGISTITFTPDGSNGWDVSVLLTPTTFENFTSNLPVDSTHFDIEFWSGGSMTTIYDNTIATNQTENTGANGAGVYYVAVTYNFSDGTAFVVYGYYLVDATNTILKSVVISGVTINSVTGLVMDIEASVVQTNCAVDYAWIGVKTDNSFYPLGTGDSGTFTLQPTTNKIVFLPLLEDDSDFDDYDGDPTSIQTIIIS